MSKISLKHSGGKVVSLNSPTTEPNANDVAFKLPNQDGSANEFLKTDGSGNLSFGAAGGGKFASYAIIADQKSNSTKGGVFTYGDWRTRDLNTELTDADGIVSISSNQFTLQAGSYLIEAQAPAYAINRHMAKLYQTSGTPADVAFGTSEFVSYSYLGYTVSEVKARVTISSATTYEIRHRCQSNYTGDNGFGYASEFGNVETYTVVKIFKEV